MQSSIPDACKREGDSEVGEVEARVREVGDSFERDLCVVTWNSFLVACLSNEI